MKIFIFIPQESETVINGLIKFPADYEVTISKHNAALFRDANRDLEYLIALEPDSVYNG